MPTLGYLIEQLNSYDYEISTFLPAIVADMLYKPIKNKMLRWRHVVENIFEIKIEWIEYYLI
jgi:hypothetical protein